jgi:hypothetical protein
MSEINYFKIFVLSKIHMTNDVNELHVHIIHRSGYQLYNYRRLGKKKHIMERGIIGDKNHGMLIVCAMQGKRKGNKGEELFVETRITED